MRRCAAVFVTVAFGVSFVSSARGDDDPVPAPGPDPAPPALAETRHSSDERRTLRQLPANLGRGALGVWSRSSLAPFVVGAALTGLSTTLDDQTAHPSGPGEGGLEKFSQAGSSLGQGLIVGVAAAGLFIGGRMARSDRFRSTTYDMLVGSLVNAAYTEVLKVSTQRERPDGSNKMSFPSGHTSNSFTWATIVQQHYGWKAGIPAYAVAAAIGASRITQGAHHLSDVVAGATLGVIVGRAVVAQNGKPKRGLNRLAFSPIVGGHRTYGLAVSVALD